MGGPLAPAANTIFDAAVLACKASFAAANMKFYDRIVNVTSGDKRRYLKVTWEASDKPEVNEQNFNIAKAIFWEHMAGYMYMTIVATDSFAIAVREVMYQGEADIGY